MSEYRIKYDKKIMGLFERCIKLGYKPYFHMPHKTPRGYEIETLLIIEWFGGIHIHINNICISRGRFESNVWYDNADKNFKSNDGIIYFTKQEAQLAAIEKGLEILESLKTN
ncbi:MAG: hypothetical protein CMC55_05915 [Flavobacteriaceae bacterium]|nr:hypothetical protein [Flavobacteriaceae bacterium]|tara:strand:- start:807 stop:1142 length:336 start_codon:yes stop_codon:yes gene_type:complete